MIQFDCPHCGKLIRLKEEFAGRKGSCPHCKSPIVAPAAAPPSPPAARSRPARPASPPQAIPVAQEAEPAYYEDDDGAAAEPVIARGAAKSKKKKSQSLPMPVVIGAAAAGVVIVGVVIWLAMRPGSGATQPNAGTPVATPGPSVPAAPTAGPPTAQPSRPQAAPGAAATAAPRNSLFAFLPDGLEAMAGARVAESLKAEDKALARAQLEATLGPVLVQTGVKLDQVDEAVLGSGASDQLLVAIRLLQAVDSGAVRKNLGCTAGPQKIAGLDVYPLPREPESAEAAVCFVDGRTVLVGTTSLVQKSLEAPPGAKPPPVLASVVDQGGSKTHLWMLAQMPVLKSQVGQLGGFGVADVLFAPALAKISHVAMGFDLTHGIELRLALECASDADAQTVRAAADSLKIALRDAEKKSAAQRSAPSNSSGGSSGGPGGMQGGPGGMQGGLGGGPGGPGGGPGGPGGMAGGPAGPGGRPGGPGGMPGGMPGGGMPGGGGESSPGDLWDKTTITQSGKQVLVALPIVKVAGGRSSPLDLFGSSAQASFARTATGSPIFPGPLRRSWHALRSIEQKDGSLPAGSVIVEKIPRAVQRLSWMVHLLPYVGEQELYNEINLSETWTHEKNLPAAATIVEAFLDPLVPQRRFKGYPLDGAAVTHFVGMGGVGPEGPRLPKDHPQAGIFGYDRKTALADVRDGTGNTILMIQARDVYGPWVQAGGATVRAAQSPPYIGATGGFGSPGDTGVVTIFADGSVRFLSKNIDPAIFEALCTINGGEKVDPSTFAPPAAGDARK